MAIEKSPRFDLTFSYWIFVWFLIYYCVSLANRVTKDDTNMDEVRDNGDKWTIPNPKIWLIMGLVFNLLMVATMIYYRNSLKYILMFGSINCTIKLLPIWLLQNTPFLWSDFGAGAALFTTYLGWLAYNGKTYKSFLGEGVERIKENKPVGPFMTLAGNLRFPRTPSLKQ
jgi:hypothetical protein